VQGGQKKELMKGETGKCKSPTKKELQWIERFKKLAAKCPSKLWLFSGAGTLHVMKTPENGEEMTETGGVNPDNSIDTVSIRNDGGDW
jgi:hypothetical protein